MLGVLYVKYRVFCWYVECRHAKCRGAVLGYYFQPSLRVWNEIGAYQSEFLNKLGEGSLPLSQVIRLR